MTRLMYDGVTPASVPPGAALYAGYVNGKWQSYAGLVARFPTAKHVTICVNATGTARVLDVESGDATPEQAPGWCEDQRRAGEPYPVVYVGEDNWPSVRSEFGVQAVAEPLYWVAAYVDDPSQVPAIPAGAIALQYFDYGGYDASVVADYWPGVDPAPIPPALPKPPQTVPFEEDPVQIEPLSVHPGEYALVVPPNVGTLALVADGYSQPAAGVRLAIWVGNSCTVLDDVTIGGTSNAHTFGHPLPTGCTGVTVRRLDVQPYPVGIGFRP